MPQVAATEVGTGEEWLAELYDRYGQAAYGLALRVLRDPTLAEDAVEDAFLAAWRSADYRPERSSLRSWILMLVHRRAVDVVRREQHRRGSPAAHMPDLAADSAEDTAIVRLERRRVLEALEQLSPEQRELIELAYYGGLTQSELAERLGVPRGTIKSRTSAALAGLRAHLVEPEAVSSSRSGGTHEHAGGGR
jgi:RNA polymerase sigma-70 factor (ECF subfamily)